MTTYQNRALMCAAVAAIWMCAGAAQPGEFEPVSPNETAVEIVDGVFSARLNAQGCASGFEAACSPTRQRAEYVSTQAHGHGERIAYRWEIKVGDAWAFNAVDKHLYATRFLTSDEKPVVQFYLGDDYGYEVNRKTCFGPEDFGDWHAVEMRVVWDATKRKSLKDPTPGELHILCDGREIFSKAGRPNIKEGDTVRLALGLEGALKLAEGDTVSVRFRNVEIGTW